MNSQGNIQEVFLCVCVCFSWLAITTHFYLECNGRKKPEDSPEDLALSLNVIWILSE